MKRSIRHTCTAALMAIVLLIACTGCDPVTLSLLSNATSWTAGFVTGTLTTISQTGTRCYVNGTEVDCSTLPSGM